MKHLHKNSQLMKSYFHEYNLIHYNYTMFKKHSGDNLTTRRWCWGYFCLTNIATTCPLYFNIILTLCWRPTKIVWSHNTWYRWLILFLRPITWRWSKLMLIMMAKKTRVWAEIIGTVTSMWNINLGYSRVHTFSYLLLALSLLSHS